MPYFNYHKYHAQRTKIDGHVFDSKKEANRYAELKILERMGSIRDLVLQPVFILQEKIKDIRPIKYRADFQYFDVLNNTVVVEDVKGFKTKEYLIKIKIFRAKYPDIEFMEV